MRHLDINKMELFSKSDFYIKRNIVVDQLYIKSIEIVAIDEDKKFYDLSINSINLLISKIEIFSAPKIINIINF